ncbi:TIR domain-containing protein [Thiocapsa rosea]|uniref:TIR domain-containing protein n=2 Tax=Thiocapsa rosea TaxID=69360 RepID=A0A495VDE3_9GAMM|nr:TIR domain-containing protein [Thiocapsa rosea]
MARKLFVSHSSKTPENLALLEDVCALLGPSGAGFDVLVDQGGGIPAGADWELKLNEWMAECHAAVILFSKAALHDSDWVKKEAAILSWRREVEDGFTLIPVLLDDLTPEDLAKGLFGVLRVNKDQCVRCEATGQAITDAIVEGLGAPPGPSPRTPFERLEDAVARILLRQADPDTLEDIWQAITSKHKPQWRPDGGERFAAVLARHLLRDSGRALIELKILLDKIRPRVARDQADELLRYLAGLWVSAEAAGGIPAARRGSRLVALNGNYFAEFTGLRYLQRAWLLTNLWRLVLVNNRTLDGILEDIRAEFRPVRRVLDAAVDRRINGYDQPIVVFLPQPDDGGQLPDAELLEALRTHFPNAVFVVPTGPDLPEGIEASIGAKPLLPPLDLQVEEDQLFAFDDASRFIENQLYGNP